MSDDDKVVNILDRAHQALLGSLNVMGEDRDRWFHLGQAQGETLVIGPEHSLPKGLILQFREPYRDGLTLPWPEAEKHVRFMPGKVTIWSGPTFSGKTAFLRQLMLSGMKQGHNVLFISLEEEPIDVFREFICCAALTRTPTKNQVEWALDYLTDKLLVFDSTELLDPTVMLGIIRYTCARHKITHVVIDSLMRLGLAIDDYEGQRKFGNLLGRVAKLSRAHLHVVAHPRKTANSRADMDLYDIRGAQDIVSQADLVATLERKHEPDRRADSVLRIWKQRGDCNWIGSMGLHYDQASRQLKFNPHDEPIRYLPEEAYT